MTSVLKVEVGESAFDWPTAIEDVSHLPPPEELASMKLEDLLRVFADNMSMRTILERLAKSSADVPDEKSSSNLPELDPHKRVDTSAFMLQRTRRFSYAMEGLKRPIVSAVLHPKATRLAPLWSHRPFGACQSTDS